MANERFTDLPVTSAATMTDIICAVQGYTSPGNLGLSVQETLQQVFNLFQNNIILFYAGNPNGNVAGVTYQFVWDTTDNLLYICTTSGTSSTAQWTLVTSGGAGNFNTVTGTSASMLIDSTYQPNNAGLVTLTLPVLSPSGSIINVVGYGAGGWKIAQNSGQKILIGSAASTAGTGGYIASTNQYDSISLKCVVANTTWQANIGPQGIITYA
jgi:hypothetical protein